jgi:predicted MFS family arabinose efflux permease
LGWAYPFVLPILAVPIGFVVLFALENPEPKSEQGLRRYFQQAWESIRHRQAMGLFALVLMNFAIIYGAYLTYLPFLMEYTFQASPLVIGIVMSGMSLATALTSSQLGKLARSWSQKALLQASCGFYAAALVMIPLTTNLWALGIAIILFGVAQGLSIPNLQTLLAGLAPIEHRGAFMSVNGMILRLGQTVGPPLMGTVFSVWGIDSTFYAAAAVAGAMFMLTATVVKKRRSDGG